MSTLVDVRRGEALDTLELIDEGGNVIILHAHGVHPDEQRRTREAALRLLAPVVAAVTRTPPQ